MLLESAAIVSLCARRRFVFASLISSTAAVVRSRYWRTERIISAGGSVKATSPAMPTCSYAIVAASATGPNSAKWKRAQWKRSNQIVVQGTRSAKLMTRQSKPLLTTAKIAPAKIAAGTRQSLRAWNTTEAAPAESAKFEASKTALWNSLRIRIDWATAARIAIAIVVPVSKRNALARMPMAETLTLPRP